jgi:hypothetical protein
MLKERTTIEKVRAEARHQHLDVREELLNKLQDPINNRDRDSQKMLADGMEMYASAEAQANSTIKQEEELGTHVHVVVEREGAVDELEQKLQKREVLDDLRLECKVAGLVMHESSLDSREATLAAEQKCFKDARASVLPRELAAHVRCNTQIFARK